VIIDPQVDFHKGGTLQVEGANDDAERMKDFIIKNKHSISNIIVSLDYHQPGHIGFAEYWKNSSGEHPDPLTNIKYENGSWFGYTNGIKQGKFEPTDAENHTWAQYYCEKLQRTRPEGHTIWPLHCLQGSKGAHIVPDIEEALTEWTNLHTNKSVVYIYKGQNNRTEMYSALKAEVIDPDDARTALNEKVIQFMNKHRQILIGGQAKSHCVKETVKDISKNTTKPIYVLSDTTSPIPDGAKFNLGDFDRVTEIWSTTNQLKTILRD